MKPRVAHLAARLPVGGMETVVARLASHVPASAFASEIWCIDALDALGEELARSGHTVRLLKRYAPQDPSLFARLACRLIAHSIDILHCHDELAWFYGTWAARAVPRTRVVMTMHGRRATMEPRHVREQQRLSRHTHALVCVSGFLRQQVIGELDLPPERVLFVPNGIPCQPPTAPGDRERARALLGVPADAFVIGSVGELSAVKNFSLALDAVHVARRDIRDLRLVVVGDGSMRSMLEFTIASKRLNGVVRLAGVRRDVSRLLPAFDMYLCTSKYEGISLSILEAMSHGLPVLATDVGGNHELLGRSGCGALVPSDDVDGLITAMVDLSRDVGRRASLGEAAAAEVRARYSIESMIAGYDRLYRSTLGLKAREWVYQAHGAA